MKFHIGLSPCPNDTFMFDAWVNSKIDLPSEHTFDFYFADIKSLNQLASNNEPDVTKISVFAAGQLINEYELLTSGAAIGYKNGPIIISKRKIYPDEIPYAKIGIPGFNTTANLLLQLFYKPFQVPKEYFFNEIEESVLSNEIDAGVIIHETRFTYQKKGLKKIIDLGEKWESVYSFPLPLGVIAVKRSLPKEVKKIINSLMSQSVRYATLYPEQSVEFIKQHAQETADDVIKQHIQLYVNDSSIEINQKGKEAIKKMFDEGVRLHLLPQSTLNIFIDEE
ncbi:MAG: 1,4-dihydroxy-6-naphthoate synthase [Bacteroidales bacterium]